MVYHSSKFAQKRKKILIWRISLIIIFLIVVILGTSYWSQHSSMTISDVIIEGDHFVEKEEILKKIEKLIEGNYFLGYSRNNFMIVPRKKIKTQIKEEYSAVRDVKVSLPSIDTLKIELIEHLPEAFWCQRSEDRECYLLNQEGAVFLKEPLIHDYDFFEFYGYIEDSHPIGQQYMSIDFFQSILKFIELLSRLEIKIHKIETSDNHTFDLITEENTKIIISTEDNIFDIFDNLQTIMDQHAIDKSQFSNIDYIDLRFGNRVFYKIK